MRIYEFGHTADGRDNTIGESCPRDTIYHMEVVDKIGTMSDWIAFAKHCSIDQPLTLL